MRQDVQQKGLGLQGGDPKARSISDGFLGSRLVTYKRPRTYEFVTTPLRGDDGEVRRTALRAERAAPRA